MIFITFITFSIKRIETHAALGADPMSAVVSKLSGSLSAVGWFLLTALSVIAENHGVLALETMRVVVRALSTVRN